MNMVEVKVSELTGPALDWAVAECEGEDYLPAPVYDGIGNYWESTCYSTDWSLGGPIIEREGIRWNKANGMFYAWTPDHPWFDPLHEPFEDGNPGTMWRGFAYGQSIPIAAMRCYVASVKGETVLVPAELAGGAP